MNDQTTLAGEVARAFRDHGITAALTALIGGTMILAAAAILLFLFNLRRAGERAGSAAERLDTRERTDAIHRQMLDAAARRPPDRDALADRLHDGRF